MDNIVLLQKIWKRIYNSKSGCPDVELGHVLSVMTDALVESKNFPDFGNEAENWALAYVSIEGETYPGNVRAAWSDKVPRYTEERDELGYQKLRPFDEYEDDLMAYDAKMAEAIKNLIAYGSLIVTDLGLLRNSK